MDQALLRKIPKTDIILSGAAMTAACERYPYAFVKAAVQRYTAGLRAAILDGSLCEIPSMPDIERAILAMLSDNGMYSLKRVINATGVVLHTNLGRAPLGAEVCEHIADAARGYSDLEYDLENGRRGSRYAHIEKLLCELTGAEAAMVVNNNAGAVFLILNTLAKQKRVAISRGELVEIGGSFRVPEIMEQSGAELVEIGTTNKTHLVDYENAINENGASVLLKVHTSNFAMIGFTESVGLDEMVALGHSCGCIVMYDAGAAFMFTPELLGMHDGDVVSRCVQSGVDVVCFSGDKLFGSAQAGIILGKKEYISRIRANHLTRMLRIDKLSLAALEASLSYYRDPYLAKEKIPVLAMASLPAEACKARAEALSALMQKKAPSFEVSVIAVKDEIGGGSLPGVTLEGYALSIECGVFSPDEIEAHLRSRPVPIIARVSKGCVLISARTLFDGDTEDIVEAFAALGAKA